MRILGLDVGTKTIGVAMSDPTGSIAQGIKTLSRRGVLADCQEVERLVREHSIGTIVLGLPLNMDGTEGAQALFVRGFLEELQKRVIDCPILLRDERLSTVGAERGLLEADLSRAKRRKVINQMAAAFVLQGYLDAQRNR